MFARERKVIDAILNYKEIIFFTLISVIALVVRGYLFSFQSYDLKTFLLPWYNEISNLGGIKALDKQIGNYGITYQFLIALFTYLPVKPIFMYKALSVLFDYILALVGASLVSKLCDSRSKPLFLLSYASILFIPTVIMNSGLWGQCDSIYCSFILLALLKLIQEKKISPFIFLGIAFAFKFQTIFILPAFILIYLRNKKFSILSFGIAFLSFYVCCLPGIVMGRSWESPIVVYVNQVKETRINLNYPNLSGIINELNNSSIYNYIILKELLIFFALGVLAIGSYYLFIRFNKWARDQIIIYSLWIVWTSVIFLPSMHERYGYLVDVLLVIVSFKYPLFLFNTIVSVLEGWCTYILVLFGIRLSMPLLSFVGVINYSIFSVIVFFSLYSKIYNNYIANIKS